jgi:hypothetical protein
VQPWDRVECEQHVHVACLYAVLTVWGPRTGRCGCALGGGGGVGGVEGEVRQDIVEF